MTAWSCFVPRIGLLALALLALVACAFARADAPPGEVVDHDARALEAYRRGDLETAQTEWTDALAGTSGYERARILYDLGNVAFRAGRTLEAVGWYTSSLRLRPRDEDAWANLEEARSRAKLEPADRGDLSDTAMRALRSFTPGEARWLALGGVLLFAGALAYEALRGGRAARWLAFGVFCLAAISAGPWIDSLLHRHADPVLVVRAEGAVVRSEPREQGAKIAEIAPGAVAQRLDELPDWTLVRLENGGKGWVRAPDVFRLRR